MSVNGFTAAIFAVLSVSIALVLSPWNTASLGTNLEIDATASVVREKVRSPEKQMCGAIRITKRHWSLQAYTHSSRIYAEYLMTSA
jgi:hypothetical protein